MQCNIMILERANKLLILLPIPTGPDLQQAEGAVPQEESEKSADVGDEPVEAVDDVLLSDVVVAGSRWQ